MGFAGCGFVGEKGRRGRGFGLRVGLKLGLGGGLRVEFFGAQFSAVAKSPRSEAPCPVDTINLIHQAILRRALPSLPRMRAL